MSSKRKDLDPMQERTWQLWGLVSPEHLPEMSSFASGTLDPFPAGLSCLGERRDAER